MLEAAQAGRHAGQGRCWSARSRFLSLAKSHDAGFDPLALLERALPVYAEIVASLPTAGAEWIQFDEPILVTDLSTEQLDALRTAYTGDRRSQGHRQDHASRPAFDHVGEA